MQRKKEPKKVLKLLLKSVTVVSAIVSMVMMLFTVVSATALDRDDGSILGFKLFTVQNDPMSKNEKNDGVTVHFKTGDVVIIKELSTDRKAELTEGEIIAFRSQNPIDNGQIITHTIRGCIYDREGNRFGYVTYGTGADMDDDGIVELRHIQGKYVGKLSSFSPFFAFLKTTHGYVVCILLPFLLFIFCSAANAIHLFQKYRWGELEKIERERAAIAAERKRNAELLQRALASKERFERECIALSAVALPQKNAEETDKQETEQ